MCDTLAPGSAKHGFSLSHTQDSLALIEQHKSGFERPGDLEFEDYSQGINRTSSESSLGTPKGPLDLLGKNKSKPFWLFSKKSKVGRHVVEVMLNAQDVTSLS